MDVIYVMVFIYFFFFFKQKTAYELRISDWSSDVCSSDLVEVVALAGALAHAGEHRQAGVLGRDVVDQLEHVDRLAHAGAAEQADLAALGERAHQVDDLDAGFQDRKSTRLNSSH